MGNYKEEHMARRDKINYYLDLAEVKNFLLTHGLNKFTITTFQKRKNQDQKFKNTLKNKLKK